MKVYNKVRVRIVPTRTFLFCTNHIKEAFMDNKENAVGFYVRELSNAMKKYKETDECNSEIRNITMMQRWIIWYLTENANHDVYQRELENALNIGKSTLTEVLNLMEKNSLVTRVASQKDARCKKIVLTEKSIQINCEISHRIKAAEEKMKKDIPQEELDMFLKNIKKMIANISED